MDEHDRFADTVDHVKNDVEEKFEDTLEDARREIDDLNNEVKGVVIGQSETNRKKIIENGETAEEQAAAEEGAAAEGEEAGESFEQVNYNGNASEQPLEHHIHTDDEPLKQVDAGDLDEEPAEGGGGETEEPEGGETEEVEARIIAYDTAEEAAEEQAAQEEGDEEAKKEEEEIAAEEMKQEEYAEVGAEESMEPEAEQGRELGDGEMDTSRFEEVPAEVAAPVDDAVASDEKDPEKRSTESELFDVFKLFDYETNETINKNDLGNVLRCMQLNPTEADVKALSEELGSEDAKIAWSDFLPKVVDIMETEKFKPATEDELITAFSLLDTEKKGFLTLDQLKTALLKMGEPLNDEEFEEMLASASDFDADCFNYVEYAKLLVCN